jgi:hypothetical protein
VVTGSKVELIARLLQADKYVGKSLPTGTAEVDARPSLIRKAFAKTHSAPLTLRTPSSQLSLSPLQLVA